MTARDAIAITGGIGSGKSFVGTLFAERGWLVVDADRLGHEALDIERDEVGARWHILREGRIDRKALADIVFADPTELRALEAITHPLIEEMVLQAVNGADRQVAVEVSVYSFLGRLGYDILLVDASLETRRGRAVKRGMDLLDFDRRAALQPDREQWLAMADYVVLNDGADLGAGIGAFIDWAS